MWCAPLSFPRSRRVPAILVAAGLSIVATIAPAGDWPQGPGSRFDFTADETSVPAAWSASLDRNVAWRTTLPETGQSTPVFAGGRVFLTTMKPVEADAESGSDIVAYCLSAADGSLLWQREILGNPKYVTRLSGPFGDASSPAAVTDGKHAWFLNPSGRLVCFDFDGEEQWSREVTSVSRTRPVLHDGKLIFHQQNYLPDENGKFPHQRDESGKHTWTQLQALDAETGELVWKTECGAGMGCVPLVQELQNGTPVMIVGRGGGHGPPETPDGISMIRADDGRTLWTLELPSFMSTQTYPIVDDQVLVFHRGDHLWIDAKTGEISRQVDFITKVPVRRWTENGRETMKESLPSKKPRSITQQSNLRVGDYHYFRAYTANYLGRIHLESGEVEYLELPLQVLREPGHPEQVLWNATHRKSDLAPAGKKSGLSLTAFRHNTVTNSRGFTVMGDDRARQNGWGHTAAPLPTAFGNRLHVPILCGLVFVIQADAEVLDESAVLAINDLGPLGEAFTRASVTTDGTKVFGRTIREVIAFGAPASTGN